KGVSTGRYILYNDCKNLRNDFSMEDAKKIQVNELLEYLLPNKPNNVRAMTLDKQEYSDQTKVPVGTPTQSTHTKI
ncbi:MAG: hypothetical protein Q8942_02395, partial [Bacillota bacterium]|nr:hypothetical protein [Bacillota bacterium]